MKKNDLIIMNWYSQILSMTTKYSKYIKITSYALIDTIDQNFIENYK